MEEQGARLGLGFEGPTHETIAFRSPRGYPRSFLQRVQTQSLRLDNMSQGSSLAHGDQRHPVLYFFAHLARRY